MTSWLPPLLAVFAGVLTWTFLEYMIHRFLGHDARFRPNPFATEHIRHHSEGDYFAPTWKKVGAAAIVTGLLYWPATQLLGSSAGLAYLGGLMGFYAAYEVLHRLEHTHAGVTPLGRWARRHHFSHHYSDTRWNHGVTTPLWDLVFGTYRPVTTIRVPTRFEMPWLRDKATGAVRAEYASTFVVADAAQGPRASA